MGLKMMSHIMSLVELVWYRPWYLPEYVSLRHFIYSTLHLYLFAGTTVTMLNGPVLAEDQDIGPNAVVKYRLLGPRVDLFTVEATTGNIFVQTLRY